MKKNKKINILVAVSLLLSLITINVQNVWAESYTVTHVHVDGGNVSNPSTNPIVANDGSWGVLPGEYFEVSSGGYAYCADPGSGTPSGNMTVVDMGGDKYQKAFDYICNQIGGKTPGAQEVSYLKAYSVYSGFATCRDNDGKNTCDGYKALMDGYAKWNPSFGNFDIVDAVKAAASAQNSPVASKPQFTVKGNSIELNATVKGKLKATNPGGYDIKVNGQSFAEKEYSAGTYTITIDTSNCNSSQEVSFVFEYEERLVSQGYTAKRLKSSTQGNQELIYCAPSSSTCDNGVCEAKEKLTPTCNPNTCEDDPNPIVDKIPGESDGAGLCDADGKTIVHIYETPGDMYASSDELVCLVENEDDYLATDTILGDNPFCKIYCTQDYILELPGPDARNSVDEMFINAGTYFTITEDGNMFSENAVTCYGTTDTEAYKNALLALRLKVANAYNKYALAKGYVNGTEQEHVENITDPETGEVIETKYTCSYDYTYDRIDTSGDSFRDDPRWSHQSKDGKCSEVSFDEYTADDVDDLKAKYVDSIKSTDPKNPGAEMQLQTITEQLNQCVNWDFTEFKKIADDEECETEIYFDYYDNLVTPDIEGTTTFKDESLETSSIKDETMKTGANISYSASGVNVTFNCNASGCSAADLNGTSKVKNIEDYKGGTITVKTDYEFVGDEFCVDYDTGAVLTGDACSDDDETVSKKITGFPVSLDTPQGRYYYQYSYSGIGYDLGEDASMCVGKFDSELINADSIQCYYDVNSCYDCNVECEGPGCELNIPDCHGNGCKVACVGGGCIFDINAGFLATFRTISLNDEEFAEVALLSASPNTLLAYNSSEEFGKSNWDNEKGRNASAEISGKGESIYGGEPEYSITLTPIVINDIKGYNKDNEDNGGYLNDTLTCTRNKDNNEDYGKCTSSFVTDYITKNSSEIFEVYPGNWQGESFVGPAWK